VGLLILALLAIAVLSPFLSTGYYQDDSINSVFPAYLGIRGLSLSQFIAGGIRHWLFVEARVYPLGLTIGYSTWYFITHLLSYRIIQVGLVVTNVLLLVELIRAMGGGIRRALAGGLIALGLFQLRDYHDPIASYTFLMQVSFALGGGAVLLFLRHLKAPHPWLLASSLALYGCGLLHYETSLAFFPVLLFLALRLRRGGGGTRADRWGHVVITAFYFAVVLALRLTRSTVYNGTQIKVGLRVFKTFLFQISAALPLSYPIFGRSGFFSAKTLTSPEFLTLGAFAIFVAGAYAFYLALRQTASPSPDRLNSQLRVFAWSLVLVPSVLVALSHKYQDQVNRPGIGYLPVYLSYFGVAILLSGILTRTRWPRAFSALFGLVLAMTYSTNWIAAGQLNLYWKDPRAVLERALDAGLLKNLEPEARVVVSPSYNWISPEFFFYHGVKSIRLEGLSTDSKGAHLLRIRAGQAGQGEAVLGTIDEVEWSAKEKTVPERILTSRPLEVAWVDHEAVRLGAVELGKADLMSAVVTRSAAQFDSPAARLKH
jgi:hypothetical protein